MCVTEERRSCSCFVAAREAAAVARRERHRDPTAARSLGREPRLCEARLASFLFSRVRRRYRSYAAAVCALAIARAARLLVRRHRHRARRDDDPPSDTADLRGGTGGGALLPPRPSAEGEEGP